ncbi:MAG: AAA family ATPase [Sphaerobacteraceae bacterium]|nr:MAG: AAA family ATPase [Sphaerobacteraceae bacterium]
MIDEQPDRSNVHAEQLTEPVVEHEVTDNLEDLLAVLPPKLVPALLELNGEDGRGNLIEIVLDLGRRPGARFHGHEVFLSNDEVTRDDLNFVAERIGTFGDDNRAGIERTLHRISAIRSRTQDIVGLTCRIGRAVYGTIGMLRDLVESGESILLLGRPGVGKTTMLRETARVLADDLRKRVVVVDTSNEIAGDGDIPHPSIGRARRMQVPTPSLQHSVMIEAVENHMPEVIVIDEIGTELEAAAARTIAERGVQLIGTAHGNTLENLMMNPTLSDLVGGIQSVTLSDEEAKRRGTQKSVLERKAPPSFSVMVELQERDRFAVYKDVAESVDSVLRGSEPDLEIRERKEDGSVETSNVRPVRSQDELEQQSNRKGKRQQRQERARTSDDLDREANRQAVREENGQRAAVTPRTMFGVGRGTREKPVRIFAFGVSRNRLDQAINQLAAPAVIVRDLKTADAVVTLKNYYRQRPKPLREAESRGLPVFVLRSNTVTQMANLMGSLFTDQHSEEGADAIDNWEDDGEEPIPEDQIAAAMFEAETAIHDVLRGSRSVELRPQASRIRRLQHELAERYNVESRSLGSDPFRHVEVLRRGEFA